MKKIYSNFLCFKQNDEHKRTADAMVNFKNRFNILSDKEAFSFDTLNIESIEESISDITLFPNAAKDRITIQTKHTIIDRVEIYSINGQRVMQINNTLNNTIDISQLESAVYLVKLYNYLGASTSIKLVKQ